MFTPFLALRRQVGAADLALFQASEQLHRSRAERQHRRRGGHGRRIDDRPRT
jgi:hypothetical protein